MCICCTSSFPTMEKYGARLAVTKDTEPKDMNMELKDQKENVEEDISGDGGVLKTVLQQGEGYEKPETGDEVYGT